MDGPRRQLLASFLAMESPRSVVNLAREVGDGVISDVAQSFFYNSCLNNSVARKFPPSRLYRSNVLKLIILAAESEGQEVLDDLYNQYTGLLNASEYSVSCALESFNGGAQRCYKSYIYSISDNALDTLAICLGNVLASKLKDLVLTIQISTNMLEGSTGCYAWPAGIFLSEFVLANPAIFSRRSCLEIGAGAGLSSICLALLNASQVIATDGNRSTLANLKHNFSVNGILLGDQHQTTIVKCEELLWENANEDVVANFAADIIVGADLIYDPECIPGLVRLLKLFLSRGCKQENGQAERVAAAGNRDVHIEHQNQIENHNYVRPIAYLATVIRNIETLNMFVSSACFAGLYVEDVTQSMRPPVFVPQIAHIDRSSICLHRCSIRPNASPQSGD